MPGLTVFGRHILRLLGCNLAQFHVGGPQFLLDTDDDFRRDAVVVVLFPDNGNDFLEPAVSVRLGLFCVLALLDEGRNES